MLYRGEHCYTVCRHSTLPVSKGSPTTNGAQGADDDTLRNAPKGKSRLACAQKAHENWNVPRAPHDLPKSLSKARLAMSCSAIALRCSTAGSTVTRSPAARRALACCANILGSHARDGAPTDNRSARALAARRNGLRGSITARRKPAALTAMARELACHGASIDNRSTRTSAAGPSGRKKPLEPHALS